MGTPGRSRSFIESGFRPVAAYQNASVRDSFQLLGGGGSGCVRASRRAHRASFESSFTIADTLLLEEVSFRDFLDLRVPEGLLLLVGLLPDGPLELRGLM